MEEDSQLMYLVGMKPVQFNVPETRSAGKQ